MENGKTDEKTPGKMSAGLAIIAKRTMAGMGKVMPRETTRPRTSPKAIGIEQSKGNELDSAYGIDVGNDIDV